MSGEIEVLLNARGGVGSARELIAAGVSRRTIEAAVRRGVVMRVRQDALVLAALRDAATPWERRVLDARAVGHSLARSDGHHALSHESALAVQGLPYYELDALVHLVRTDGRRGRRDAKVFVHRPVDSSWVVMSDELRVVEPALAALQVAAAHGIEAGVVALDGVLHRAEEEDRAATGQGGGPARRWVDELTALALAQGFGTATPVVRRVVEAADGRSESTGESRARWLLVALGWACTPHVELRDADGRFVARVDLLLDGLRVVVEFDGVGKYTSQGVLIAEKDREDRIRSLGYEVVRLRWADLDRPAYVRQLILEAIARAGARAA